MATIDSLPYEIEFIILSQTGLRDLSSFFQTNKVNYSLSLRNEYRNLIFGPIDKDRWYIITPDCPFKLDLMRDILLNRDKYNGMWWKAHNFNPRKLNIRGKVASNFSKYGLIEH